MKHKLSFPISINFLCSEAAASSVGDDLEAELEADLENMKLEDIDTSDVNLDDEGLLED